MKVIVTGGCGYVGSRLVPELLSNGHEVLVLDTQWFGNHLEEKQGDHLTVVKMDIREALREHDSGWGDLDPDVLPAYDAMIHLAAVANDPSAELDPGLAWEVNVLGTLDMLKLAKHMFVRRFIYASSGSVYGVSDRPNVTEDTELAPISLYNKTKMVAESVVKGFADDMEVVILRPGTLYGVSPRMRLDLLLNTFAMQAVKGEIIVHGGKQVRPVLRVDDMVRAYLWALNKYVAGPETYNVSSENITVSEAASRIGDLWDEEGYPSKLTILPSNDPRSYRMDSSRIREAGFNLPSKEIHISVLEVCRAALKGGIKDEAVNYNVRWMKQNGIK